MACSKPLSDPVITAELLLETKLGGYGPKRLAQLDQPVLVELCRRVTDGCDADAPVDVMVATLLKYKQRQRTTPHMIHKPPSTDEAAPDAKSEAGSEAGSEAEGPVASRTRASIWKKRDVVRICAFNALKLRIDKDGLELAWDELLEALAGVDIIAMSEVRASENLFQKRAIETLDRLNAAKTGEWTMSVSDASGPGTPEVHILLLKAPLVERKSQTLLKIGDMSMDHAPFSVLVEDPRLGDGAPLIAVTSVHMPPESRRRDRDAQIPRLLESYATQAEYRLNTPFTDKGAKDEEAARGARAVRRLERPRGRCQIQGGCPWLRGFVWQVHLYNRRGQGIRQLCTICKHTRPLHHLRTCTGVCKASELCQGHHRSLRPQSHPTRARALTRQAHSRESGVLGTAPLAPTPCMHAEYVALPCACIVCVSCGFHPCAPS